jgi:hypothetical protein
MTDPAAFRQKYPEFDDPVIFSDDVIAIWDEVAAGLVNAQRWKTLTQYGRELVIAHHLRIAQQDADDAEIGAQPGKVVGVQTAKAVDKVSSSYDVSRVTHEGAGFWNQTNYGVRYWQLARMMGAGPLVTC